MKKFYIPIFAMVFILSSFLSQGQVYNSITSNPSNYTLDDARFWVPGWQSRPPIQMHQLYYKDFCKCNYGAKWL